MYSIVSLFEENQSGPWRELSNICSDLGLQPHVIPHFSWQSAENYDLELLHTRLSKLSQEISAFKITTSGFGIFSNDRKIIFLLIVKTKKLLEIHELLWEVLTPAATLPKLHYAPENWIPHISLNLESLTEDQIGCAVQALSKQNLQFEFTIHKLAVLFLNKESSGVDSIFPLGKERAE